MRKLSQLNSSTIPDWVWVECMHQVMDWIFSDRTSSSENLKEKAKNYALNWLLLHPEVPDFERKCVANRMAEEIEEELKDHPFDNTPLAVLNAHKARKAIPAQPENRFIRLR